MNNMKIQKLVLTFFSFFAFGIQIGCGGISPGEGPGFPENLTAQQLFTGVSQSVYIPDTVPEIGTSINDTFDCENGGSVTIVSDVDETGGTAKLSYSNCEAVRYIGGTGYQLKLNGSAHITGHQSENSINTSFRQSMSYGGDLGFAATCDYSAARENNETTIEGECSYEDSEGRTLNHDLAASNSLN